jgi:osmotically inducible lipoprotein OsmB
MRSTLKAGILALALITMPFAAQAGPLEGAAIGAGSGLVIAGPPGAVVGGVIGAVVGGPDVVRPHRRQHCWYNRDGYRTCGWR